MHTITALCRLTGLNASTLRSWERRYGMPKPGRALNGRRSYPQSEVDKLVRISRLIDQGHAIGELSRLSLAQLDDMGGRLGSTLLDDRTPGIVQGLHDAMTTRDLHAYRRSAGEVILLLPAAQAADSVFVPVLRRLGEERAAGRLPLYVEQLAITTMTQLLFATARAQHWPHHGPRILFTALEGASEGWRSLLAWHITLSAGYDATYIGADLPVDQISFAAAELPADLIVISTGDVPDNAYGLNQLSVLSRSTADVWMFKGSRQSLDDPRFSGLRLFDSMRTFEEALTLRFRR